MPEPARLVVADTSPLLYLHQAQQLHLLQALYGARGERGANLSVKLLTCMCKHA